MPSTVPNLFAPPIPETAPGILLFCFPYAGGSPYLFMDWRSRLEPELQVTALQAPGHGVRLNEIPYRTAEEIISEIMENLPAVGNRRFAFYGHSLGAILAFELARRLRKAGMPQPCHLFVGAARPPQLGPTLPALSGLDEREFLEGVQSRYSGIPAAILNDPEVLSLFLPALRADFAVYESYIYRPELPLASPISAFSGMRDPHVPAELMKGWATQTSGDFSLRALRGDHFFLEKSRDELTGSIRHQLTAAS